MIDVLIHLVLASYLSGYLWNAATFAYIYSH